MMNPQQKLLAELRSRKLLHQVTDEEGFVNFNEFVVGYAGFDPTADSLHVGHLLPIRILWWLKQFGFKPIALVGGATGSIGDPSGKTSERELLEEEVTEFNSKSIQTQLLSILGEETTVVNNQEWFSTMNIVTFLRDVGKHFSVNAMLQKDSVKSRIETREQGISFTEFAYALLQGRDFVELNNRFNCNLQIGGSDQWGNIVGGIDLLKREGKAGFGITVPLLAKSDGKKFGKSETGAVWLSSTKTNPFDFFQFFVNVSDEDVERLLFSLTDCSVQEIEQAMKLHKEKPEARCAQMLLAENVTRFVHGEQVLNEVKELTAFLFQDVKFTSLSEESRKRVASSIPKTTIEKTCLFETTLENALVELCGLGIKSKTQARNLILSGAVKVNDKVVVDPKITFCSLTPIDEKFFLISKGKKSFFLVETTEVKQ